MSVRAYMEEYPLPKHLQRVYPLCGSVTRSCSSLTLSSLYLSENSIDEDSLLDFTLGMWITGSLQGSNLQASEYEHRAFSRERSVLDVGNDRSLKRRKWITKSSDQVLVSFHDECWGVPVFNDIRLFELLALSGLLIDYNWTEILEKRELYRKAFANFDYKAVAEMDEEDVMETSSMKGLSLGERGDRCIVDNAKCIQKVAKEYGSFSGYIWSHVNHRPIVNKLKHPKRNILKSPKSNSISEDLVRRGFGLVGAMAVYSFMQAAGMVIDHDVDCFRFCECVGLTERSWGMTNIAMYPLSTDDVHNRPNFWNFWFYVESIFVSRVTVF